MWRSLSFVGHWKSLRPMDWSCSHLPWDSFYQRSVFTSGKLHELPAKQARTNSLLLSQTVPGRTSGLGQAQWRLSGFLVPWLFTRPHSCLHLMLSVTLPWCHAFGPLCAARTCCLWVSLHCGCFWILLSVQSSSAPSPSWFNSSVGGNLALMLLLL